MTKRYAVSEQRGSRMEFLGVAPAGSPEDAIAKVRRYAMRGGDVRMTAKVFKVTAR